MTDRHPLHNEISERCVEAHRRLDHTVTLEALRRDTGRKAPSLFPEGPCIPQPMANDSEALVRACLGILRAHREEIAALQERMAAIEKLLAGLEEEEMLKWIYAERARKCFESTIHSSKRVEKIEAIARALEQAALDEIKRAIEIVEEEYIGTPMFRHPQHDPKDAVVQRLRARLAELRPEQEEKDAKTR